MTSDPLDLLRQARSGEKDALGRLLDSYAPYLMLLVRVPIGRGLRGKVDPADLVQETFLEAHRQFDRFRGTSEAEFTAWLRRILAGQLALLLRRYVGTQGRDVRLETNLATQIDRSSLMLDRGLVANTSTPSQQASRREQAVLLSDALSRIAEVYQQVIVLRHLEGLPFADVARRMGRSEDSVQKLWVRALANLRKVMAGQP